MSSKAVDTRLARRLQDRGGWNSYSSCLREVRIRLDRGLTPSEIRIAIDAGELDPPVKPDIRK